MYLPTIKTILLLSALLAVSSSSIRFLAGEHLHDQPFGEAGETVEFELESESECKEGFELILPACFVIQASGFDASLPKLPQLEELLRVVHEQHAPRPPPVLFA